MGTDIHLYVEKLVDGRWEVCVPPRKPTYDPSKDSWWDCFYDRECYGVYVDDVEVDCPFTMAQLAGVVHCVRCNDTGRCLRWYRSRNYTVFGVLAGVRGRVRAIVAPRGCPDDVSDAVRYGHSWDHTPSWLLVSELLAHKYPNSDEDDCEDFTDFVRKWLVPIGPPDQVRIVFGFDS